MTPINSLFPEADVSKYKFFWLTVFFFCLHIADGFAQDNLLRRKVNITTRETPIDSVLLVISDEAKFTFSYDASILTSGKKISVSAQDESVKSTLDQILPQNIDYKVSGNHLILLKKVEEQATKREKITVSGTVYDETTNRPLADVVVFEISSLTSSVSNDRGEFSITVPVEFEQVGVSFAKHAFEDQFVFLQPENQEISVSLLPEVETLRSASLSASTSTAVPAVESISFVQQIVPTQSRVRSRNSGLVREKFAQVSFLPMVGTNLKMSGSIQNNYSLNLLIGYSYGVDAFELGGLFNIVRKDVNGVQIGGLGNFVGENTRGFQMGGLFNHNRGSFAGLQIGGINNMIVDTLRGVQISGINNILNGGMKGWQLAGINNLTTQNVDGVQIGGISNIALQDVRMLQIGGIGNTCKNVRGVQFAGIINLAQQEVRGFQLAGILNLGGNVNAIQFAGIGNISRGTVSGAQVSSIFNYARYTKSSQISLFNLADSASGTPIGFISYVKKGFHTPEFSSNEITPANIAFKTGVRRFYNIFSAGIGNWKGKNRWMFGYGIGSEKIIDKNWLLSFEYTSNWVNEDNRLQKELSLLNKLDLNFGWRPGKKFAISAGPSVNLWLTEWVDSDTGEYLSELAPYTIAEKKWGPTLAQSWIGGRIAVHW